MKGCKDERRIIVKKKTIIKIICTLIGLIGLFVIVQCVYFAFVGVIGIQLHDGLTGGTDKYNFEWSRSAAGFVVADVPTPNISPGVNSVRGIVLHHTACANYIQALESLTSHSSRVSCHVMIDTDGSRYVLASPDKITWHAGRSRLNGRDWCNQFTIGIEFQGNTLEKPLTDAQIESAIEYILPIMKQYRIPLKNIVTHEQIRENYKKAHPNKKVPSKVDITQEEYARFMKALKSKMNDTQIKTNCK